MKRKFLLLLFLLIPLTGYAGGTVSFEKDVKPILMQRPVFAKVLLDTFEFRNTVQAETVGREVSPALALARIGPYRVFAKKKGEAEYSMVIQINTTTHFLDRSGKETNVLAKAVSLREDFDSIEIDPLPETAKPVPAKP
jgi:hypothetical protein